MQAPIKQDSIKKKETGKTDVNPYISGKKDDKKKNVGSKKASVAEGKAEED